MCKLSGTGEKNRVGAASGGVDEGWNVNQAQDLGSTGWSSWGYNNQEKDIDGYDAIVTPARQSTEPPATPWDSSTRKQPTHDWVSADKWSKTAESTKKQSNDQSYETTGHREWQSRKVKADFTGDNSSWEKPGLPSNKLKQIRIGSKSTIDEA